MDWARQISAAAAAADFPRLAASILVMSVIVVAFKSHGVAARLSTRRAAFLSQQVTIRDTMATSAVAESTRVLCEARNISQDFTLPNGQQLRVAGARQRHGSARARSSRCLGPSGSGKSTILRMPRGAHHPDAW